MAKFKNTISDNNKRKGPKPGSKKNEAALKLQYSRTKFLNKIASELNSIITVYSGPDFKSSDYYQRMLHHFRQEPLNNRVLLLQQLVGMEVNKKYQAGRSYAYPRVKAENKTITVTLHTVTHPPQRRGARFNCYYYEVVLLTWNKTEKPPLHSSQITEWIPCDKDKREFDFLFRKPAGTTHWLISLRRVTGVNEEPIKGLVGQGMYVADVGTFDIKEQELLEERKKEKQAQKAAGRLIDNNRARVKAKKKEQ